MDDTEDDSSEMTFSSSSSDSDPNSPSEPSTDASASSSDTGGDKIPAISDSFYLPSFKTDPRHFSHLGRFFIPKTEPGECFLGYGLKKQISSQVFKFNSLSYQQSFLYSQDAIYFFGIDPNSKPPHSKKPAFLRSFQHFSKLDVDSQQEEISSIILLQTDVFRSFFRRDTSCSFFFVYVCEGQICSLRWNTSSNGTTTPHPNPSISGQKVYSVGPWHFVTSATSDGSTVYDLYGVNTTPPVHTIDLVFDDVFPSTEDSVYVPEVDSFKNKARPYSILKRSAFDISIYEFNRPDNKDCPSNPFKEYNLSLVDELENVFLSERSILFTVYCPDPRIFLVSVDSQRNRLLVYQIEKSRTNDSVMTISQLGERDIENEILNISVQKIVTTGIYIYIFISHPNDLIKSYIFKINGTFQLTEGQQISNIISELAHDIPPPKVTFPVFLHKEKTREKNCDLTARTASSPLTIKPKDSTRHFSFCTDSLFPLGDKGTIKLKFDASSSIIPSQVCFWEITPTDHRNTLDTDPKFTVHVHSLDEYTTFSFNFDFSKQFYSSLSSNKPSERMFRFGLKFFNPSNSGIDVVKIQECVISSIFPLTKPNFGNYSFINVYTQPPLPYTDNSPFCGNILNYEKGVPQILAHNTQYGCKSADTLKNGMISNSQLHFPSHDDALYIHPPDAVSKDPPDAVSKDPPDAVSKDLIKKLKKKCSTQRIRNIPILKILLLLQIKRPTTRIFIVGGAVRDLLFNKGLNEISDIDIAIGGIDYETLKKDISDAFARNGVSLNPSIFRTEGKSETFGMMKIIQDPRTDADDLDIGLLKSRLNPLYNSDVSPSNKYVYGFTLRGDASTRDFTYNAIYVDILQEQVCDPTKFFENDFNRNNDNPRRITLRSAPLALKTAGFLPENDYKEIMKQDIGGLFRYFRERQRTIPNIKIVRDDSTDSEIRKYFPCDLNSKLYTKTQWVTKCFKKLFLGKKKTPKQMKDWFEDHDYSKIWDEIHRICSEPDIYFPQWEENGIEFIKFFNEIGELSPLASPSPSLNSTSPNTPLHGKRPRDSPSNLPTQDTNRNNSRTSSPQKT